MWPLGIGLDLLAQLPDIDPQILRVRCVAPDLTQQELVGQNLPGVLDQNPEQIVLLRRELDLLIAHRHEAACDIDRELTNADQRALAFGLDLMAQGGRMRARSSFIPNGFEAGSCSA